MNRPRAGRRTVRVRIEGGVQGVGYRYWTERVAAELRLTGWVRNRRDGSVEALFAGTADDVAQMLERCKDGPRAARVTAVEIVEEGGEAPNGFSVLPTA
jgi:acylphosphatase